jgi:hypothetical protein
MPYKKGEYYDNGSGKIETLSKLGSGFVLGAKVSSRAQVR